MDKHKNLLEELEMHKESLLADLEELPNVKDHQRPTLEKYITAVADDFEGIMEKARKVLGGM